MLPGGDENPSVRFPALKVRAHKKSLRSWSALRGPMKANDIRHSSLLRPATRDQQATGPGYLFIHYAADDHMQIDTPGGALSTTNNE